ncbi:MAG TPA: RNA polymerase sigma factor [Candidatus Onthomonas avicola]|nr:RNA polymerase sigma factor [Candidatus Onthomonas avicola]
MERFEDVFQLYAQPVYRFLLKLTGNGDWAEELTQETFYQAFLHIGSFRGDGNLYTWLCQIGKNAWRRELRRRRRFSDQQPPEISSGRHEPERQAIVRAQAEAILTAIEALPARYAEVLTLRLLGERSVRETAQMLGQTENWVKVTYFRGKEKLMRRLEELGWNEIAPL